ncbi:MAG TPA: hypothetical protein VEZ55_01225 [Chitinophagaceae bacterium]|jgi:hypothetical protein|nr:hypothetical protein [Chitinophagaceae bacterium]
MTKSKRQRSLSSAPKLKIKGSFEAIVAAAEKNTAKRKEAQINGYRINILPV